MTSIVRGLRAMQAAARGALNAAALDVFLADAGNMNSFNQLLQMPALMTRIASSDQAMAALAGSALAISASVASRTAVDAITQSNTAMAAVAASNNAAIMFSTPYAALRSANTASAVAILAASANAMAQLVGSVAAMAAITGTPIGMNAVIGNQPAMDSINAMAAAKNAFRASGALTTVVTPMFASYGGTFTSPSASPPGAYFVTKSNASDDLGGLGQANAYNLFDKTNDGTLVSLWRTQAPNNANQWVAMQFPVPVHVYAATLAIFDGAASNTIKDWRIEYSDDGANWISASPTATNPNVASSTATVDINKAGKHLYWRLFALNNYGGTNMSAGELTFAAFA